MNGKKLSSDLHPKEEIMSYSTKAVCMKKNDSAGMFSFKIFSNNSSKGNLRYQSGSEEFDFRKERIKVDKIVENSYDILREENSQSIHETFKKGFNP